MKLIRCYIENFGVLHQYSLELEDHMTLLCQENGSGKTTLTIFLQTMFYGFPRSNKNLNKDLRRKYKPWQGGEYGGFIVFEYQGETYRLERYFGDRPSQDTWALFTLNPLKASDRFDKDIGYSLFGLDEESYARSSFIPQSMLGSDISVPGLTASLTAMVENTEDIHQYDHAMEALKEKRASLTPYRGQSGKINQLSQRISELQDTAYRLDQARTELAERMEAKTDKEIDLENLKEELDQVDSKIRLANEALLKRHLYKEYVRLNRTNEELGLKIQAMDMTYPRGFPSEEAMDQALTAIANADESQLREDQAEYDFLASRKKDLDQRYPDNSLTQPVLDQMQDQFDQILSAYDQLDANQELLEKDHSANQESAGEFRKTSLHLATATICLIAALAFFLFQFFIPGITCLVIGLVNLLIMLTRRQHSFVTTEEEVDLMDKNHQLRDLVQTLEKDLQKRLLVFYPSTGISQYHIQLQQLSQDLKELEDGQLRMEELEEKIQANAQIIQTAHNQVHNFMNQYKLSSDCMNGKALMQVKSDHDSYIRLQEAYRQNADHLSAFLIEHGPEVTMAPVQDPSRLPDLKDDYRVLAIRKDTLQKELAHEGQIISQLKQKADQLPQILDQIREYTLTRQDLIRQSRCLDLAMEHLKEARESLTGQYLDKLLDRFLYYTSQVREESPDKAACFLTPDLELALDTQGAARAMTSFSAGTTDLYMFCMRLALVDILYPDNRPLLILDDPFVNLDKKHADKAMALLKSLPDQQILYLTCHESRYLNVE